jgi:hypothetical protein
VRGYFFPQSHSSFVIATFATDLPQQTTQRTKMPRDVPHSHWRPLSYGDEFLFLGKGLGKLL